MSLSTHVLDSSRGRPVAGVRVRLERRDDQRWAAVAEGLTDDDGRLRDWAGAERLDGGVYRLVFDTGAYFAAQGVETFFPEVTVVFSLADSGHYHVPLLLSPFAYSTYRGS